MTKDLHAVEFDGTTFGMSINTDTTAYKNFKKQIKSERAVDAFGKEFVARTVPYLALASIMGKAHWLVSELKSFNKIRIDGYMDEDIYIKYTNELDLRDRFGQE